MILLDTNTIVHYIKGDPGIISRMHSASPGDMGVPSIVVYELEHGTLQSKSARRRTLVRNVLKDLNVIPFDRDAALETARLQVELEKIGIRIGPMDTLIAGIVLSRNATLVTNNTREFSRVKGLKLADWRASLE